jgi:hypothetical protein
VHDASDARAVERRRRARVGRALRIVALRLPKHDARSENVQRDADRAEPRTFPMTHATTTTNEARRFLDLAEECRLVCLQTATHCVTIGGDHARAQVVHLLRTCAKICKTSVASWMIGSRLCRDVLEACRKLCVESARTCEGLGNDKQMLQCAALCLACADACQSMADEAPAHGADESGLARMPRPDRTEAQDASRGSDWVVRPSDRAA